MMENIVNYFLLFMFYAFCGWVVEIISGIINHHKLSNRGFLIGPICPIYGVGALLLSLFLEKSEGNLLAIFCVGVIGGVVLEYVTSYMMEKMFKVRWWDYSQMPFNLNGRICLQAAILFGFAAVLIHNFTTPWFLETISGISLEWRIGIAAMLLMIFVIDFGISMMMINKFKVTVGTVRKDATDEISQNVRQVLMENGKLTKRLVKAFPDFEAQRKDDE